VTGHAETVAIKKAKSLKGNTIVVLRLSSDGKFVMAKPCITCIEALRMTNIKNIWYSTNEGWVRESINNIKGIYSSGIRYLKKI
jgi:tRNA(Arg) A34 adenosine deaminase TadA|tara:strand:- start:478 stop:729 length:252 start_codon:yes stop_codon:yes gene_type:complete